MFGTLTVQNISAELTFSFNLPQMCQMFPVDICVLSLRFNHYAFIFQLAERGMNVVIISRTKATLDQVAEEIGIKSHVLFL